MQGLAGAHYFKGISRGRSIDKLKGVTPKYGRHILPPVEFFSENSSDAQTKHEKLKGEALFF